MNPLQKIVHWYFRKATLPYWCVLLTDCAVVFAMMLLAYWVFNRTGEMFDNRFDVLYTALLYAVLSVIGAKVFRTYSGVVRFSSFVDLMKVSYASMLNMVIALVVSWLVEAYEVPELAAFTQSVIVVGYVMATVVMWGIRVIVKTLYDVSFQDNRMMRVLIYGALSGGVGLAKAIRTQRPVRFRLCGFISHDKRAKHMQLMGENVYNVDDDLKAVIKKKHIKAVLVSPLRVEEFRDNQEVQDLLIDAGCKIFMAQTVKEVNVKDGQLMDDDDMRDMQLKEVSVEDLLPRSEIKVNMKTVGEVLQGRRVLVTGAAGSIGSEIVRQVASFPSVKLMLVDQAETPEHDIRLMMAKEFPDVENKTVVTSITDESRMEQIFKAFRPEYVFHAAAYKHVPMMEDNPSEAVKNNIYGTKVIADLSVKYGVKKFVMISTDKAVNPTNVMGCSKRICEIYVQSLNNSQKTTQFVTTRFGNVLGSNGSVIPLFREQIKNGGPVTVTDERIVRFFMLIPEACQLVLEAGTKGNGGEIFVFDMGKPVKIADLAKRMIALSGAKGVEIKYTGLREGEKLYEEVLSEMEGTKPTFHDKIRIAEVRQYDYKKVCKDIEKLIDIAKHYDNMATVKKMKEIVPEYKSNNSVYEKLDEK